MSQLSELILQAKKQKGLNELFSTQAGLTVSWSAENIQATKPSLMSKLDELEIQLFPCIHLSSVKVGEVINALEGIMDDL